MLNFAQPLTEVHGCLMTSGDKEEDVMRTVVGSERAIMRRYRGTGEVETVCRDISLFLALNTDLDWPSGLSHLDGLASCVGMTEPLSKSVFIKIIRNSMHQNFQKQEKT